MVKFVTSLCSFPSILLSVMYGSSKDPHITDEKGNKGLKMEGERAFTGSYLKVFIDQGPVT